MVLNVCADPPDCVGNKANPFIWVILSHCKHQADIAFLNKIKHLEPIMAVFVGNFYHKTQIRSDQSMGGFKIFFFKKSNGYAMFFFLAQQGKLSDFCQIERQTVRNKRQICYHDSISFYMS